MKIMWNALSPFAIFFGRHMVILVKYFIKMCSVGEVQFFRNLGHIFFRVFQHVCRGRHGKRHAIVKQAFAGKFFHDSAKVGAVIIEDL